MTVEVGGGTAVAAAIVFLALVIAFVRFPILIVVVLGAAMLFGWDTVTGVLDSMWTTLTGIKPPPK